MNDPDDVTITSGGKVIGGWQTVRITRGIEIMPSSFDIALTELYPGQADEVVVQPLAPCVVRLGRDAVVTGYIDRYLPTISAREHGVRIQGRGKCEDLVDCSVLIDGMVINKPSALKLAQDLSAPFGIAASSTATEPEVPIPQISINIGETPFEVIDKVARYRQVLAYEGADGNLILAQVGSTMAASGFTEGVNIEAAGAAFSADQRFSEYRVYWTSTDDLKQVRDATGGTNGNEHGLALDDELQRIGRYRPRLIVSEQTNAGQDIGQDRAVWEMNRRNGRSQSITLTCDSWRDSAGALWAPNTLVPLSAPHLKLVAKIWLIAEVTYRRDGNGTHADLVLMPPKAFALAPASLAGVDFQVQRALQEQGGAATAPPAGPAAIAATAPDPSGVRVNLTPPPDPNAKPG